MFEQYPKKRIMLSESYQDIYAQYYKINRQGNAKISFLAKKLEAWMHVKVSADLVNNLQELNTLEIGAGTLNHLIYEPQLKAYDIVEPLKELYQDSPQLARIQNIYQDIKDIPKNQKYQRIISIAVFEHICNLPEMIARCGLLLNEGGSLRVAIPSEGGWLWRLGWQFTTALEFKRKYKLDYKLLMEYEHVNTAFEVREALEYFFHNISVSWLGLTKNISFYQFCACCQPDKERCLDWLDKHEQTK